MNKTKAYIFDPYYLAKHCYKNNENIQLDFNHPFNYNRIVTLSRLDSTEKKDFALGKRENREALIISKC